MNILNLLTLGLLPLGKMLMSNGPDDPRRFGHTFVYFERWGNPKPEKIKKALKKFFSSEAERAEAYRMLIEDGSIYTGNVDQAEDLIEAIEKVGFNLNSTDVFNASPPVFWDEKDKGYRYVTSYNLCNNCGRTAIRLYQDFNRTYSCSSCGSEDVIDPKSLNTKEFVKHVKTFSTLTAKAGGKKRTASGGAKRSVDDFEYDDNGD